MHFFFSGELIFYSCLHHMDEYIMQCLTADTYGCGAYHTDTSKNHELYTTNSALLQAMV